ncbi:MAG: HepT-like ribonuclease domain-containing protein [Nitrospirota bacterium]
MKLKKVIKENALKECFERNPKVALAFIFGSYATGFAHKESDFDVAVYLKEYPCSLLSSEVIYYEKGIMQEEDEIFIEVSHIVPKEVNVVCLNIAPASLISNVFRTGIPLVIKDRKLYLELYLRASSEAEDFLRFCEDFYRIKQKAKSLNEEAKNKLLLRVDFLGDQVKEFERFRSLTQQEYQENIDKRRIIERWTENTINAMIDIAKIVLASEHRPMPGSYEDTLFHFGFLVGLSEEESKRFSKFANLRNILAHEYMDILYQKIQGFVKGFAPLYEKINGFLDGYLEIKELSND